MNSPANAENMAFPQNEAIDVEILSPEFSSSGIVTTVRETTANMLSSALDNIVSTSPQKLERIETITFKARYRFEVIPEEMEMAITLKK